MKLFKLYVIIGFILLIIGIVFDFGFVRTPDRFVETVENSHNTWQNYVCNLMRFYLIILGLVNIVFALFIRKASKVGKLSWIIFGCLEFGAMILLFGLIWSAHIIPSVASTVSAPYYLEFTGLSFVLLSIILKGYQIISDELTD
ncbi:MAG: hypothetical protein HY811_08100 [Planctomycetes bacterium]|nr:hypothetical protein [Planctomycetota bacterium]